MVAVGDGDGVVVGEGNIEGGANAEALADGNGLMEGSAEDARDGLADAIADGLGGWAMTGLTTKASTRHVEEKADCQVNVLVKAGSPRLSPERVPVWVTVT
jgi:hypothetical protein